MMLMIFECFNYASLLAIRTSYAIRIYYLFTHFFQRSLEFSTVLMWLCQPNGKIAYLYMILLYTYKNNLV